MMNKNVETNRKWKIVSVGLTLISVVLIGNNLLNANDADTRVDFSSSQQEFQDRYCDYNGLSGSEIQKKFLRSTNDLFNANIQILADNEKKRNEELARGGQADNVNLANVPPQESDFEKSPFKSLCKDQNDFQCKMFAVCKNNASSYCVGINAMGFSPRFAGKYNTEEINNNFSYLKTSYSCYKSAMELKKDDVKEASDMRKIQDCLSGLNSDSALCKKVDELEKTSNKDKKTQLNSEIRAILSSEASLTNISDIGAFVVRRENQTG